MGIVAHCPNGHRLNVKDAYAGRKCLCPQCGTKFRIPTAATAAVAGLPVARLLELDPALVEGLPRVIRLEDSRETSADVDPSDPTGRNDGS